MTARGRKLPVRSFESRRSPGRAGGLAHHRSRRARPPRRDRRPVHRPRRGRVWGPGRRIAAPDGFRVGWSILGEQFADDGAGTPPRTAGRYRRRCWDRRGREGVIAERSAKPQVRHRLAARAMATRWRVRLVEPPVAIRPTMPLTKARSSRTSPTGKKFPPFDRSEHAGDGGTGQRAMRRRVGGRSRAGCSPMNSISI